MTQSTNKKFLSPADISTNITAVPLLLLISGLNINLFILPISLSLTIATGGFFGLLSLVGIGIWIHLFAIKKNGMEPADNHNKKWNPYCRYTLLPFTTMIGVTFSITVIFISAIATGITGGFVALGIMAIIALTIFAREKYFAEKHKSFSKNQIGTNNDDPKINEKNNNSAKKKCLENTRRLEEAIPKNKKITPSEPIEHLLSALLNILSIEKCNNPNEVFQYIDTIKKNDISMDFKNAYELKPVHLKADTSDWCLKSLKNGTFLKSIQHLLDQCNTPDDKIKLNIIKNKMISLALPSISGQHNENKNVLNKTKENLMQLFNQHTTPALQPNLNGERKQKRQSLTTQATLYPNPNRTTIAAENNQESDQKNEKKLTT